MAKAVEIRRVWEFRTEGDDVHDLVADGEGEQYVITLGNELVLWTTDIDDLCEALQDAKVWLEKQSNVISGG